MNLSCLRGILSIFVSTTAVIHRYIQIEKLQPLEGGRRTVIVRRTPAWITEWNGVYDAYLKYYNRVCNSGFETGGSLPVTKGRKRMNHDANLKWTCTGVLEKSSRRRKTQTLFMTILPLWFLLTKTVCWCNRSREFVCFSIWLSSRPWVGQSMGFFASSFPPSHRRRRRHRRP